MKVPIFDLRVKNKLIREELRDSLEKVISKGRLFLGDQVDELEKKVAKFLGVKYALGVSSGSLERFIS